MKEQRRGGRSDNRKEQQGERSNKEEGARKRKGQQRGRGNKEEGATRKEKN